MKAKIKILRFEGLGNIEKPLSCHIHINKELIKSIILLVPQDQNPNSHKAEKLEIPCEGEIKLTLTSTDQIPIYKGSTSIKIQSLPLKGYVWLPLSQNIEKDSIQNTVSSFYSPRILLSIQKPTTPKDNSALYKLQIKKLEFLIQQLESRVVDTNKIYEQEKQARNDMAIAYETLKSKYNEYVEKSQLRELSILMLLEKKDKELQENFSKNCSLENRFQTLDLERTALQAKIQQLKNSQNDDLAKKLAKEIQELEKNVVLLRKKEMDLIEKLKKLGENWLQATKSLGLDGHFTLESLRATEHINEISLKAQILELTETNKVLRQKLYKISQEKENLSSKIFEMEEINFQQNLSFCDKKKQDLERTMIEQSVKELLDKTSDGYYFNNRKLELSVEQGKVVVKSWPLEEFLQVSLTSVVDRSLLVENRY